MPLAKICRAPNCNKLIPSDKAYCEAHQPLPKIPFANATRSNEVFYKTHRWRTLRKKIIAETPYCYKCGLDKYLEVHHKIPPRGEEDLFYDEGNCAPVCKRCHRLITAGEILRRDI